MLCWTHVDDFYIDPRTHTTGPKSIWYSSHYQNLSGTDVSNQNLSGMEVVNQYLSGTVVSHPNIPGTVVSYIFGSCFFNVCFIFTVCCNYTPRNEVVRVIMFLTGLPVSQSVRHSGFLVNATPLKPLHKIS